MSASTASLSSDLKVIQVRVAPLQDKIAEHPLLDKITDIRAVRFLMQQHVFAVWDFVCLLKTLYSRVIGCDVPWFPSQDPDSARLLYELLIEEETDRLPAPNSAGHTHQSHFCLYLAAMRECGADTQPIETCLERLKAGQSLDEALQHPGILSTTRAFVAQTFSTFQASTPALVASFVFGREAMIPAFFNPWLQQLIMHKVPHCGLLTYYLERHIALDSDAHFPKAANMLARLCGEDKLTWQQASQMAESALEARLAFLEGVDREKHHSKAVLS
jgi:hypothetical protein